MKKSEKSKEKKKLDKSKKGKKEIKIIQKDIEIKEIKEEPTLEENLEQQEEIINDNHFQNFLKLSGRRISAPVLEQIASSQAGPVFVRTPQKNEFEKNNESQINYSLKSNQLDYSMKTNETTKYQMNVSSPLFTPIQNSQENNSRMFALDPMGGTKFDNSWNAEPKMAHANLTDNTKRLPFEKEEKKYYPK